MARSGVEVACVMVGGSTLSGELSDAEWLDGLRRIGERDGYFSPLGKKHAAVLIDRGQSVLFVAFESLFSIRSVSDTGLPLGFDVCSGDRDWSHLTLITTGQDWYRDPRVWTYFDRLIDHGFFENFDQVVFYGAGMCGYAAAAYSVASPGATVLLVSPQATLERPLTEWDDRFPSARKLDFSSRYGYAPEMLEAAEAAYIVFDPNEAEDAMHARLFKGANISHQRYRRGRSGAIEADLRAMGFLSEFTETLVHGEMTTGRLAELLRHRRRHVPYLRALLARVLAEDRPELTVRLCKAVLKTTPIPRFRHHLESAQRRLTPDSEGLMESNGHT